MKTRNFITKRPGFKTEGFNSGNEILKLNFNSDKGQKQN